MKDKSKLISKCVAKAKKYLDDIKALEGKIGVYQADISELALEVCDIRHGGYSKDIYTIKDFANDIGMHPKTLQNWVSAYRTVVPIVGRERIKTPEDWGHVRKTKREVGDGAPAKQVLAVFDQCSGSEEKPFFGELRNSTAAVKHLKYMLDKRELGMVDPLKWIELMQELDQCSDMINEYLTKNKKKLKVG